MFLNKKKRQSHQDEVFYNVTVFTNDRTKEETYDEWMDVLMAAAENVGTGEWLEVDDYDTAELEIIKKRFPDVDQQQPFFFINKIDNVAVRQEIQQMESSQKWRKFFDRIPLTDYINAENRVVLNASHSLFCSNDLEEAARFLVYQEKTR
ncbi:hypothetical protein ABE021_09785 [Sporosarcina gallistercoris]|uniref:hypothetical protein n=1 Tax=Sporosarcina gallistercoris TaxID=2762245 RepID=UPI003D2BD787